MRTRMVAIVSLANKYQKCPLQPQKENRSVVSKGEGEWGRGVDWEFGIGKCKLLYP